MSKPSSSVCDNAVCKHHGFFIFLKKYLLRRKHIKMVGRSANLPAVSSAVERNSKIDNCRSTSSFRPRFIRSTGKRRSPDHLCHSYRAMEYCVDSMQGKEICTNIFRNRMDFPQAGLLEISRICIPPQDRDQIKQHLIN